MESQPNNVYLLVYISLPVALCYLVVHLFLASRTLQKSVNQVIISLFHPPGLEKGFVWPLAFRGRFTAILNALIIVPFASYIYFTNEEFYLKRDLFAHEFRGDVCLSIGYGFWIYHLFIVMIPEFRQFPLHVPHHILVLACVYLIVRDKAYQSGMLIMYATELPNPFAQGVSILVALKMKDSKLFLVNGVCLFIFWTIGRIIPTIFLLYCYYLNWTKILTLLSPTLKVMNIFGTAFAVFVNFWWYSKICRGLYHKLLVGKTKTK